MKVGIILELFKSYYKIHTFENFGSILEYNLKTKKYKNGICKLVKYSFSNKKGLLTNNKHNGSYTQDQLDRKLEKYLKKVRTNIIDLALNNDSWEYFITLTFSDEEVGEYSHDHVIDLLRKWIDNQKHQNKNFTYLLVPEFHKSGRLHFHGLVSNVPKWKFKESRNPNNNRLIKINGLQIYNLENYKLGFTTISKVQSQDKVSNYISKYATKDLIKLKNKKRYWYSRNLEKPKQDFLFIDTNLKEYLEGSSVDYYNEFIKESCSLEVAQVSENKLPIIDNM